MAETKQKQRRDLLTGTVWQGVTGHDCKTLGSIYKTRHGLQTRPTLVDIAFVLDKLMRLAGPLRYQACLIIVRTLLAVVRRVLRQDSDLAYVFFRLEDL